MTGFAVFLMMGVNAYLCFKKMMSEHKVDQICFSKNEAFLLSRATDRFAFEVDFTMHNPARVTAIYNRTTKYLLQSWINVEIYHVGKDNDSSFALDTASVTSMCIPEISSEMNQPGYSFPAQNQPKPFEDLLLLSIKFQNVSDVSLGFILESIQTFKERFRILFKGNRVAALVHRVQFSYQKSKIQDGKTDFLLSLPGTFRSATVKATDSNTNFTIHLCWLTGAYKSQNYIKEIWPVLCTENFQHITSYNHCQNFSLAGKNDWFYLYFRNQISSNFPPNVSVSRGKKSWINAVNLCQAAGGFLPMLRDMHEFDEMAALLKLKAPGIDPLHAMFLGIVKNSMKVRSPCLYL